MKIEDMTCDGQMSIDEWLSPAPDPPKTEPEYQTPVAEIESVAEAAGCSIEYGTRSCEACAWRSIEYGCKWAEYHRHPGREAPVFKYPNCDGYGHFMPCQYKVPAMCASCRWGNCFHYETKPEYMEYQRQTGRPHKQSFRDPVEEPNIYCTHPEGSLNRRTAYKDIEWEGFGATKWDRQHEWDTCDRWEPDPGDYIDYTKHFPEYKNKKYWEVHNGDCSNNIH